MAECIYSSGEPPCENAVKLVFMICNFPWTDEELETIETIIHGKMDESMDVENCR